MRTMTHTKMRPGIAILTAALFTAACSAPAPEARWQTVTFTQSKPVLAEVTDGDEQREQGEEMFFEAQIRDEGGKVIGRLLGMHDVADVTGDDGMGDPVMEDRFTNLVITFEGGDEIVISGASTYPMNEKLIKADVPQVRAIVGGTGKYKGIRGQVTTTRKADESYAHVLEYRLD